MNRRILSANRTLLAFLFFFFFVVVSNSLVYAGWEVVDTPFVSAFWDLRSVHFTSKDEGWAVGGDDVRKEGVLLHYKDGKWNEVLPPTVSSKSGWYLKSVHFPSATEGYAVGVDGSEESGQGGKGVILHYQNSSWSVVALPDPHDTYNMGWYFNSVSFVSENEGVAVGVNWDFDYNHTPFYAHFYKNDYYKNGVWLIPWGTYKYEGAGELNSVYLLPSGDGMAVGRTSNEGLSVRWDPGSGDFWDAYTGPNGWEYFGIHFTSKNEGWAVGIDRKNTSGVAAHCCDINGDLEYGLNFSPKVSDNFDLRSVHFTSKDEGWAVGYDKANKRGVLLHYKNGNWTNENPPNAGTWWGLDSVHFTSPNEGWAVGKDLYGNKGVLLKYSPGGPSPETITTPNAPSGPTSGVTGTSYSYTTGGSTSSLGHTIQYRFDWKGDGSDLSAWGSAAQTKTWTAPGTYNVKAKARCATDTSVESSWSSAITVIISTPGETIITPNAPSGPTSGVTGTSYSYTTGGSASSLGHPIQYEFDWGDGSFSAWGSTTQTNTWTAAGTYYVKAKARCATDTSVESSWSSAITVIISTQSVPIPTPDTPSGPQSGVIGTSYSYTTGGSGDAVEYQFDWGDGSFSAWGSTTQSHKWTATGTYYVRARARSTGSSLSVKDISLAATESNWSLALKVQIFLGIGETVSTPGMPSGPADGVTGTSYSYTAGGSTSNFDHPVEYQIDWGDGSHSSWGHSLGVNSITESHIWKHFGDYPVKVKARCAADTSVESGWSDYLLVFIFPETVSTPTSPDGNDKACLWGTYVYTTHGSESSLKHSVEYQFDWEGDGKSDLSPWGGTLTGFSQSKTWTTTGTHIVKVHARCVQDTTHVSGWSEPLSVLVVPCAANASIKKATKVCTPSNAYPRIPAQPAAGNFQAIAEQPPTDIRCSLDSTVELTSPPGGVSVYITDTLDDGLLLDVQSVSSVPATNFVNYDKNIMTLEPILLQTQRPPQSFQILVNYKANLKNPVGQGVPHENCFKIVVKDPNTGTDLGDARSCAKVVDLNPRFEVEELVSSSAGLPGDTKTFTVVARNTGDIYLENVSVDAQFPNNTTLSEIVDPPTAIVGNTIQWRNLGPISPSGSLGLTYSVKINPNTPEGTQLVNRAFGNAQAPNFYGSGTRQLNASSNQVTVVVSPINVGIDLTLTAQPTEVCYPQVIAYTAEVKNTGDFWLDKVELRVDQVTIPWAGNPVFPLKLDPLAPGESRIVTSPDNLCTYKDDAGVEQKCTYKGQIGPKTPSGFLIEYAIVSGIPTNQGAQVAPPVSKEAMTHVHVLSPVITKMTPEAGPQGSSNLELKIEGACFAPVQSIHGIPIRLPSLFCLNRAMALS